MAVSTSNYFSNAIIGTPQLGADIDIYRSDTSAKYAVGFGFTRADGNKYRYCHFGLLTPAAQIVGPDESESSSGMHPNCGAVLTNRAKPENTSTYANATGSRYLQLVITASADQFAGGYVMTDSSTPYTYRVKANTATSANNPVTGNILVELYEPLVQGIDSNSDLKFTGSRYANVEPILITNDDIDAAGVSVVGNSIGSYGWVCSKGIIAVLTDAGLTGTSTGYPVYLSSLTAGAVTTLVNNTSFNSLAIRSVIGTLVNPATVSDYAIINVKLE